MNTTATELPPPLVKPFRHPFKFTKNHIVLLIAAVLFAHFGTLIIVSLYYLAFETRYHIAGHIYTLNHWWHSTVSDSTLRHDIRGVAEGLLGGFLAQQVVWNHYKKKNRKPATKLDNVEMALHIPNLHRPEKGLRVSGLVISPLLGIIYAIPGFVAGYFIVKGFHNADTHLHHLIAAVSHPRGSTWTRTKTIYTSEWPQKAMGLGASFFFGRRPMKATYDNVQTYFAERRVARHKKPRFSTPTFQARYNDLVASGQSVEAAHQGVVNVLMTGILVLGFAGVVYGWYILNYYAQ